jgi:hypothetical protein
MFTTGTHDKTGLAPQDRASGYEAERSRVDAAHQRLRAITAVPHRPAQAREAARELTIALRDATDAASRALQAATLTDRPQRQHLRHHKADRSVPAAVGAWSAELVQLAEIGVWLRRTALDDTGAQLPQTVRGSASTWRQPSTPRASRDPSPRTTGHGLTRSLRQRRPEPRDGHRDPRRRIYDVR